MRIIGIDPGIAITGYGIIESDGYHSHLVDFGCIQTAPGDDMPDRLYAIHHQLSAVLQQSGATVMAVEKLFFCSNALSAMQVGEARGVVLLAGRQAGLPVCEYTPLQVKQAVVGYGRARKQQVQEMVRILLRLQQIPRPDDAADGLALALCHAHSGKLRRLAEENSHV